ncbi:protein-glutamate methylesterase/protein-glutamine glutaminase [Paenibacillus dakarensis]|uniref:protein-glutamate methylesterase/protein-glutamine glutaminase n=1 Tax=Paenibacillus dakarensis TaxID=1527293 RepID=UPI0006D5ADE9|nr:chemotaxis response regulator protein-glutamate methylesterase [Paenibacillus dakarensis]
MTPFRVLVVDDSAFMRKIISDLIEQDSRFQVVGTGTNGREAIEKVKELKPDVITMDVEMPELNGLDALRTIMEEGDHTVIMLSGVNEEGMRETILALEFGAFDFIRKPSISNAQDIEHVGSELLSQLNAAMHAKERRALWEEEEHKRREKSKANPLSPRPSDRQISFSKDELWKTSAIKPTTRGSTYLRNKNGAQIHEGQPGSNSSKRAEEGKAKPVKARQVPEEQPVSIPPKKRRQASAGVHDVGNHSVVKERDERLHKRAQDSDINQIVAVGCSTGGPRALKTLLENIPADFPAPIVIVQHMPPNFTKSLAQRLDSFSALDVKEAQDGMLLKPGAAYVAPGGRHMTVSQAVNGQYQIAIRDGELCNGHRPSVDVLFESLLPLTSLKRHVVLMTGMGSDGARMMRKLYDSGVTSTFAESEETCVVYGMPRSAVELGCVRYSLPLHSMAGKLVQAVSLEK